MSKYATLMLGDVHARVEVQDNFSGAHNDGPMSDAVIRLNEQMEPLMKIAQYVVEQTRLVSPDEVELNFGITVGSEGGFLCFAKAGIEAQFNVTMTWKSADSQET